MLTPRPLAAFDLPMNSLPGHLLAWSAHALVTCSTEGSARSRQSVSVRPDRQIDCSRAASRTAGSSDNPQKTAIQVLTRI